MLGTISKLQSKGKHPYLNRKWLLTVNHFLLILSLLLLYRSLVSILIVFEGTEYMKSLAFS